MCLSSSRWAKTASGTIYPQIQNKSPIHTLIWTAALAKVCGAEAEATLRHLPRPLVPSQWG